MERQITLYDIAYALWLTYQCECEKYDCSIGDNQYKTKSGFQFLITKAEENKSKLFAARKRDQLINGKMRHLVPDEVWRKAKREVDKLSCRALFEQYEHLDEDVMKLIEVER